MYGYSQVEKGVYVHKQISERKFKAHDEMCKRTTARIGINAFNKNEAKIPNQRG